MDQCIQAELAMVAKAAVVQAAQAFDTGGLIAGEEEAIPNPRDRGKVLMKRVFRMADWPPVGEGEGNLIDGFGWAGTRHDGS
jgi:hypothetical protein